MKKIVINTCYGGFDLSYEGVMYYAKLINKILYPRKMKYGGFLYYLNPFEGLNDEEIDKIEIFHTWGDISRDDPMLIKTVQDLGEKSWGDFSNLKIVEIPDDVEWYIEEYDGNEHVAEKHRVWR